MGNCGYYLCICTNDNIGSIKHVLLGLYNLYIYKLFKYISYLVLHIYFSPIIED